MMKAFVLKYFFFALIFSLVEFHGSLVSAARVKAVKGKKVLISLSRGESLPKNQVYLLKGKRGKATGLLKIKKVRGRKALAYLMKGRAMKGQRLYQSSVRRPKRVKKSYRHALGFVAGINSSSLDAQKSVSSQESINTNTTGISPNFKVFYDYSLTGSLALRLGAGYEPFVTEGTTSVAVCDNSKTCKVDISYLRTDAMIFYKWSGSYAPWLGAGVSFLTPVAKTSNVIKESSIGTNQSFVFALGLNKSVGANSFIPVSLEYNYFLSSTDVSTSLLALQIGYAWRF